MARVLVVDDEPGIRRSFGLILGEDGHEVHTAADASEALGIIDDVTPDVLVSDIVLPGMDGLALLDRARSLRPEMRVILVTGDPTVESAAQAVRLGAHDYLSKPVSASDLRRTVAHAVEVVQLRERNRALARERDYLRQKDRGPRRASELIGDSPALRAALERVRAVAPTDASVLIEGESGVGKELIARAIHDLSPRADQPLVFVNCASIPAQLFESEFFGHVKGSFTGAHEDREGRFELADGGTLVMDEVGEIPLELQAKLLRVLNDQTYERVGDGRTRTCNVRVIAATNRDLGSAARDGSFREDLYYRLCVFPIRVPPLRERPGDVIPLARYFLERYAHEVGVPVPALNPEHEKVLEGYDWPGNVRELRNVMERACILARAGTLRIDLPSRPRAAATPPRGEPVAARPVPPSGRTLEDIEREYIRSTLESTQWTIEGVGGAAAILGLKASTLRSKMKKLGIERSRAGAAS